MRVRRALFLFLDYAHDHTLAQIPISTSTIRLVNIPPDFVSKGITSGKYTLIFFLAI
jgi:hypothetical protein